MGKVEIEIPVFDAKKVARFLITGKTPLLMHNPAGMLKPPGPKPPSERIPKPEDEAKAGTYWNDDGSFYFPSSAFRSAMIGAAKGLKAGRAGVSGLVKAGVFPVADRVNLLHGKTGEPLTEYEIDVRRAVPRGQGAVSRARPRLDSWKCVLELEINESFLSVPVALALLQRAGEMIGIGDYRPEKGGWFGKFTAELKN